MVVSTDIIKDFNPDNTVFTCRYLREIKSHSDLGNVIERVFGLVVVYFDKLDNNYDCYFRVAFFENDDVHYSYLTSFSNSRYTFNQVLSELIYQCFDLNISLLSDFQKDLKSL